MMHPIAGAQMPADGPAFPLRIPEFQRRPRAGAERRE